MKVKVEQCEGPECENLDAPEQGYPLPLHWFRITVY